MRKSEDIKMLVDMIVQKIPYDEYGVNKPLEYKHIVRTTLEYAEYLQYTIDRLEFSEDMLDFLEEEYECLIEEKKECVNDGQMNEVKAKLNVCEKMFLIFDYGDTM